MPRRPVPALLLLVAILYSWNLGLVELSVTDEARSGVIVRDMVAGHWLLPRTPDGYLVEKPPAYYGTCALFGGLFGVNEWTLRGVSVLAALGTLAATAWIVRLFGSERAAMVTVAALSSNLLFLSAGRDAMVDMTLTFFLTVGFAGYFAGRLGRLSPERSTAICGVAFGLAMLAKGPLGLALPMAVCGGDILIETRGRFWRAQRFWAPAIGTALLSTAILGLWYIPGYVAGGREFLETSILSENFRMPMGDAKGIGVAHHKPWHYYLVRQGVAILPALPLLALVPGWLRDRASTPARRLLGSWALFGFLLFQAAANKRFYYLVALQPAMAAMIGLAADRWAERKNASPAGFLATGILLVLGGIACAALPLVSPQLAARRGAEIAAGIEEHRFWISGFGLLVVGAGGAMLAAMRGGPAALLSSAAGLALTVVAARCGVGDLLEAEFNRSRPFVCETAGKVPEAARVVIVPPIRGYSLDFYWPQPTRRVATIPPDADYVFAARATLPKLDGRFEEVGVWKEGDLEKDVLLLRRLR